MSVDYKSTDESFLKHFSKV